MNEKVYVDCARIVRHNALNALIMLPWNNDTFALWLVLPPFDDAG